VKDVIVFSHMMKTAGSSLIKSFIGQYGAKVLDVSLGTRLKNKLYDNESLKRDLKRKNNNVKVIVGHDLRPFVKYDVSDYNFHWMTFLRQPIDRYVSNYFHMYHLKNKFELSHYNSMKAINIIEWERVDHFSDYQRRFIAGEPNAQKAIDILEEKFDWVGITEEFDAGITSLKVKLGLESLYHSQKKSNPSKTEKSEINATKIEYADFIEEVNREDLILYTYVKDKIWPRYKDLSSQNHQKQKSSQFLRSINTLSYHIDNQLKFKDTKISWSSIKQFYDRWYS
jgi:hypothetical protein